MNLEVEKKDRIEQSGYSATVGNGHAYAKGPKTK
jgi:hypothetical protein